MRGCPSTASGIGRVGLPPRLVWSFGDNMAATLSTTDGVHGRFRDASDRWLKERACVALTREMRELARALQDAAGSGFQVDWRRLRIRPGGPNDLARVELERIRDFIILHYKLTERSDSEFWRTMGTMDIPDSLRNRIALFRDTGLAYQEKAELFQVDSWLQVMMGQRLRPQGRHHLGRLMSADQMKMALNGLRANIDKAVASMPTHQDFLDQYMREPELAGKA